MHPYEDLPSRALWRTGVADAGGLPSDSWCRAKWLIRRDTAIATAGSCFAQHLGRRLKREGFAVLDVEPAPDLLPAARHEEFGYGIYSARYGNIYTARQMLQLAEEAFGRRPMSEFVFEKGSRYVDALRPTIDPEGHATPEAVLAHRRHHLDRVGKLLRRADLIVFTLGLTECWEDIETGTVFPVCPGTAAGRFDPKLYRFRNLTFSETLEDLRAFRSLLRAECPQRPPRFLLTVSPVPLTATATEQHVMLATSYSKSVLRAVAGQFAAEHDDVDYFPSYEIVTNPWSPQRGYASNFRGVTEAAVETVMTTFMAVHGGGAPQQSAPLPASVAQADVEAEEAMAVICDEELLDAFGTRSA